MKKFKVILFLIIIISCVLLVSIMLPMSNDTKTKDTITIRGNSMLPTFNDGDVVNISLVSEYTDIKVGDVIVFSINDSLPYVKRVIALSGDKISIKGGYLYVNDKVYCESTIYSGSSFVTYDSEITVEYGEVFVLGDNLIDSTDSRYFGCVKFEDIYGIVREEDD